MFKRILKIVGFVLLGFVLLIGGVVGFMAIRGDFKKQKIKPTAINFTITDTKLTYDVGAENMGDANSQIYSFVVSAQPLDVTETECIVKLSNSTLITFVEWKDGELVEYNSSKFHLNTPIYFKLNDITEETEDDYYDGVLTITVKDASGLLQTTLDLEIDRNITSISFKDQSDSDNNVISNGLFAYEEAGKYDMLTIQKLEAIINQDYPLEVITAPLKASKPFVSKDEKLYEIYYIEQEQPKLLTHEGEMVKLHTYNNAGNVIEESCEFLRYDTTANCYVFNSSSSGAYEFKLATYPTYNIQNEMLSNAGMSFVERLNLGMMITKTVVITVNGTEAEQIVFNSDSSSIGMHLLNNNKWVVNNPTTLDAYNLGLTLSKLGSGTQILGRYNELKLLSGENFNNELAWKFKQAEMEEEQIAKDDKGNVKYKAGEIVINFYTDTLGNKKATLSGIDTQNILNGVEYDVVLKGPINSKYYTMTLLYKEFDDVDATKWIETSITLGLVADDLTGKVLSLEEDITGLATVDILQTDETGAQTYSNIAYLDLQVGNCFVLDAYNQEKETYTFKTLKAGLYLTIIGKEMGTSSYKLINDKFIASIEQNDADSIITIKPIDGALTSYSDKMLYAVVVNSNGSWTYTQTGISIVIDEVEAEIGVSSSTLGLPVMLGEEINYTSSFDVEDLVQVSKVGSYNQLVMFAPKYSLLKEKPTEWGNALEVYTYDGQSYIRVYIDGTTQWETSKYYVKNNFKFVDLISIVENNIEYFLLGYVENGRFVNKVVATGMNYYSQLYPVIIKTKYLLDENRLQTAEEYIQDLLKDKYATSNALINEEQVQITYDLALLPNRHIRKINACIPVTGAYDKTKTYYIYDGENYQQAEISLDIINNWESLKINYYEGINCVKANDVLGPVTEGFTSNINTNLNYYTLENNQLTPVGYSIGSLNFISNWNNYYIIVSHYIIKSTTNDGTNITITTHAVSKSIELTNLPQVFTLTVSDYNIAKNGIDGQDNKFKVNYVAIYNNDVIEATSYYDFENSQVVPTADMGGSYFAGEETQNMNNYQIIAGHSDINLGWDGTNKDPINKKTARTELYVNSKYSKEILESAINNFSVNAIEYDANGNKLGIVSNNIIQISQKGVSFEFVQANTKYDETKQYYVLDGENYKPVTIVEESVQAGEFTASGWAEVVANWEDNSSTYYNAVLFVEFTAIDTLIEGHFAKFEWSYDNVISSYKIYSPKLTTISRETKGYSIDLNETVYKAGIITQEQEPAVPYYAYNKINNEFIKVEDANKATYPYSKNTYYTLYEEAYSGTINYLLEVAYDEGYTYNVYAVDGVGNYLYYKQQEGDVEKLKVMRGEANSVALNLKVDGGWINPIPFYAVNTEFTIQGNEYIQFEDNKIVFAQITDGFTDINLKSNDATIQYAIKMKIVQDGKFEINTTNIKSSDSTTQYSLPTNIYKYNGSAIDKELDINITAFSIERINQNVSGNYRLVDNKIVEKVNEENVIAQLNFDGANWTISRTTFDNISLELEIRNLLKDEKVEFSFVSPYSGKIKTSSTNKTSVIYSGTTYVLANIDASMTNESALYVFGTMDSNQGFVIKYRKNNEAWTTITANNAQFKFIVPGVSEPTNYEFGIYYTYGENEERIGEFGLTVVPNILITTSVEDVVELNDFNNPEYDFTALNLSKYNTTKEYTSYTLEDLETLELLSNITYHYETFIDESYTIKYTTNIIKVENNKLIIVAPISEVGTYYVRVKVISNEANVGNVEVGELKFKISSKSQVVNVDNEEVDAIEITANSTKTYTLTDLQQMYNLSRSGEIYYAVAEYVEGITYKKIANGYEKMTTDEGSGYYQKLELTDILWINTNNDKLEIVYNYEANTLIQTIEYKYTQYDGEWKSGEAYYYLNNKNYIIASEKLQGTTYYTREIVQKLNYGGKTYQLIGTQYKTMGYSFDMFSNQFINSNNQVIPTANYGKNIAYAIVDGQSIIYCKQNAYLFEEIGNSENILAMAIEENGKTIYSFNAMAEFERTASIIEGGNYYRYDALTNQYVLVTDPTASYDAFVLKYTKLQLGNIKSLTLKYNGFGVNMATNAEYVDNIEYSIEAVFNNSNIKTDDIYVINVLPYVVKASTNVVLNGTDYVLYDTGLIQNKGLFNIDDNIHNGKIKSISFASSEDYTISTSNYNLNGTQTKYTINFKANGNSYVTYIPVTLTYDDGSTFSYNEKIIIENKTVVTISYPYNIEDETLRGYNVFNASISELTRAVDGTNYDVTDLAKWVGVDTSIDNWENETYIKYDLALKGDTINLIKDDLLNIARYNTYERNINDEIVAKAQSNISKIELVAVSSTYAETIQNVTESLALKGNTISISQSLNYTGYVAFKVYEGDTSAYGYYILKIVDDEEFDDVVGFSQARRTQTISKTVTEDVGIMDVIKDCGYEISTVAGIGAELVDIDNNVYLFMVNSINNGDNGKAEFKDGETIDNGNFVSNDTIITANANIQTIVVAVVIQNGTSLVHVCNYKLVLQPDVEVVPNMYNEETNSSGKVESVEDGNYHIYKAKALNYDFRNSNTIDMSTYFTLTGTQGGTLESITFDKSKSYDALLTFDGNVAKIGESAIATINGTNLTLNTPISEQVHFYLELNYSSSFKIYLRITLNPFIFNATNQFEVGNWDSIYGFNNSFDLTNVFGNYNKNYTLKYSTNGTEFKESLDGVTLNDNILTFTPSNEEFKVYVRVSLDGVVHSISKDITIVVKPNIRAEYIATGEGTTSASRVIADKIAVNDTLTQSGSQLYVDINNGKIKVQNKDKTTTYLTIDVKDLYSVEFNLTTDTGLPLYINGDNNKEFNHFVNEDNTLASAITLNSSSNLLFTHSAQNDKLRLNISVKSIDDVNYSNYYPLYITVPQTYTLTTNYRVDGATYETVVNNEALLLKTDSENTSVDKNFFGTDENNGGVVFGSRISIDINSTKYYGYDNIVALGLLTENNPNQLGFELNAPEGTNVSSIDNGVLTFRSDDNAPTVILTLTNKTTSIDYKFLVLTQDNDYSKVKYNEELLLVDSDNNKIIDYISINHSQLNEEFELAYLNYLPNSQIEGQVGWANTDNSNLTFKFETNINGGYSSKIVIDSNELDTTQTYNIEVSIITINGLENKIKLKISNFVVEYGYNSQDENAEITYAGTEIGLLTNTDANGAVRVTATVNGTNVFAQNSGYNLTYVGAVRGIITHLPFGEDVTYTPNDITLIQYNATRGISSRSVADNVYVTMIFDVKDESNNIVGRIYYSLILQNDIKIGLNTKLSTNNAVPLYLGSSIYTKNNNDTIIDLLQSNDDNGNYNNLFVTLEQYSTGNAIYDSNGKYVGKALYNGTNNAEQQTQSVLSSSKVQEYLKFEIGNISASLTGKVSVSADGKLTIDGNPSGSFTLSIFSTNGTGYGESFTISVYQYESVTSRYGSQVNIGTGVGYASGTEVDLINFKTESSSGNYAFTVHRLGYGVDGNQKMLILDSDAEVSYQVAVFDYGTTITNMKNSTIWNEIKPTQIIKDDTIDETYSYTLPSVKYSSSTDVTEYQIVSIRLVISYNGQEQYYFANYQVYNEVKISTNQYYIDNDKVITYGDSKGAWETGATLTIMDIDNKGMYSSVTPLTKEPSDWESGYSNYYKQSTIAGKYEKLTSAVKFEIGMYYQLNDIVSAEDISKYTAIIKLPDGTEKQVVMSISGATLVGTLPNNLFTNQTECTFILKSAEGSILLEDAWTIKANSTIEAKASKSLREFFLRSEIGNQDYYNINIIGIGTEYNNFVNNGVYNDIEDVVTLPNGYTLRQVTYTGEGGNDVFKIEQTYYVLVGHSEAISFDLNGGDYYINLTIDDNNITNNNLTIDLANFVNIWTYENGAFVLKRQSITLTQQGGNNWSVMGTEVTLQNIHLYTSNQSRTVQVTSSDATRVIELYFNIIINATSVDANGYMIYSNILGNAMSESDTLTSTDIENNIDLKQALLELIKFNSQNVNTNINSNEYNYFKISVEKQLDYYSIKYEYNSGFATYTRTLKMALN